MNSPREEKIKTALQVVAIAGLLGLFAMIFHKAVADISVMWRQHSGADFWVAVAHHFFRNLAG